MAAANRNKNRLLEITQVVLAFISTCGALDATIPHGTHPRAGFAASVPLEATGRDRRFADLARTERKRREALQLTSRRSAEEVAAARQRA